MNNETVKTISGKVHYLQKVALLPDSTLHVRLRNVTLRDVFPNELAVQIIPNAEKAGLNFNLTYSCADVLPGHTYAISASITREDRLIFATTQNHEVELSADHVEEQEVLVSLV